MHHTKHLLIQLGVFIDLRFFWSTYLISLSWVCPCRKCIHHYDQISGSVCVCNVSWHSKSWFQKGPEPAAMRRYWPLWFTATDGGIACRDLCDKWCHSTADLTDWKYHFRRWSRRRDVKSHLVADSSYCEDALRRRFLATFPTWSIFSGGWESDSSKDEDMRRMTLIRLLRCGNREPRVWQTTVCVTH